MSEHIEMLVKKNSVMNPDLHGSSIIIIAHGSSSNAPQMLNPEPDHYGTKECGSEGDSIRLSDWVEFFLDPEPDKKDFGSKTPQYPIKFPY